VDPPRHAIRLYNAGSQDQVLAIDGALHPLAPSSALDFDVETSDLAALVLPEDVIAVERLPIEDAETDEVHVLHTVAAATCAPTITVRVPLMSCRFGTAEAQVEPISGATYAWTVEGATVVSGNGTPSVLLGFGGAFSAVVRVNVTLDGCVSAGAAVLNLRDPLQATIAVPDANVGTPVLLTWTYNTAEPIVTQILSLPDGVPSIRLAPNVRSHVFTPATDGQKTVKLTGALYRIGARRRAVRSGSGPHASSCSFVEIERPLQVRPACAGPVARVSGGGAACGSVAVRADFEGTPPFRGRWSDGASFETTAMSIQRSVAASGMYSLDSFEDATCAGTATGTAIVTLTPQTRITALTATPSAIAWDSTTQITYSYANAASCRFTSALLGNSVSEHPSCSGTGSKSLTYWASNAAGNEEITLEATGPCGTDQRTLRFIVCAYSASVVANGPTTFCQGGSVTLSAEIAGSNAGPPYGRYSFYRCTDSQPAACQSHLEYTLVQDGTSSTYVATQSGRYRVVVEDRVGCPSVDEAGSVQVTVQSCP
jgi:hypothetical protein